MSRLDTRLGGLLEQRKEKNRFRSLKEYSSGDLVDFSSNDYLSLTTSQSLRSAYLDKLASTPSILGSTGSRLLSGGTKSHRALEERFAKFFNSPAALLFNSGWDANVSFFSSIPQPGDWVIYDELVHASVHDGLRACRVPPSHRVPFAHNDPDALRAVVKRIADQPSGSTGGTVFLALESLYSMDGDLACLPAFLDILDGFVPRERQCVVLDEAHTTGVYGLGGRGLAHALGEEGGQSDGKGRVTVRLMTFGKAVGCSGAVLLCSPTVRSFLINFARPLIFSTALPHSTLVALHCAWDLLSSSQGDELRARLMNLCIYTHSLLKPLLASTSPSTLSLPPPPLHPPFATNSSIYLPSNPISPIIGLLTPRPHALSAFLLERGFVVRPVVPPTVPPGGERVRVCLRAEMGKDVVERLVVALREWISRETSGSSSLISEHRTMAAVALRAKL